jgi:hypothetical protein
MSVGVLGFRLRPACHQRHTNELASHGFGNGSAQRCLAHARRPDKAEEWVLSAGLEFDDGQVLENAFLDFVEIVVIAIQNILRLHDVHAFRS